MSRLPGFVVVGALGFAVDAAVLAALLAASPLDPFVARLASIGVALCATWLLNRSLVFGPSGRRVAAEGARYGMVGAATSVLNYLVYAAQVAALPAMQPLAALVVASGVAMAFSFLGYSRLVFDR